MRSTTSMAHSKLLRVEWLGRTKQKYPASSMFNALDTSSDNANGLFILGALLTKLTTLNPDTRKHTSSTGSYVSGHRDSSAMCVMAISRASRINILN